MRGGLSSPFFIERNRMIYLKITAVTFVGIAILVLAISWFLFQFACRRNDKINENTALSNLEKGELSAYAPIIREGLEAFQTANKEDLWIQSRDGLSLHGYFLKTKNARGTILLTHGWRGRVGYDFSGAWRDYRAMGYNLLAIEQRTHGASEGQYICFGVKERYDLIDWIRFLNTKIGDDLPVILSGISMGSSTVMMAIGSEELPHNVVGAVADCGFTSAWDEFSYVLKTRFHLPVFPFLYVADAMSKVFAGFSFRECSTTETLQNAKVPVLFVHGEADTFVPILNTRENNTACASRHEVITVKNASHGMSYLVDHDRVKQKVTEFLNSLSERKLS